VRAFSYFGIRLLIAGTSVFSLPALAKKKQHIRIEHQESVQNRRSRRQSAINGPYVHIGLSSLSENEHLKPGKKEGIENDPMHPLQHPAKKKKKKQATPI